MNGCEVSPLRAWAASGAMALTGRPDGPPRVAPGRPAARVAEALERIGELARERTGALPALPGVEILGERAAIAGLTRRGPMSCGGAFRTVRTADGRVGLSLPRAEDLELVPALTECAVQESDSWEAVRDWALRTPTAEAAQRIALLGLAGSAVPDPDANSRAGVRITEFGPRKHRRTDPVVLDLTALWAGPLCAHLLGLTGARVIKVESVSRPDGARFGPPAFFDLLHHGHAMVGLDFHDPRDIERLRALIADADLVLEASRARALHQLGIDATACAASGTAWLSITARGRASNTVGFGDDIAAAAGLVVADADELLPCGDALADPLTGVCAAEAASHALAAGHARLIDISMLHLSAETTTGTIEDHVVRRHGDGWQVESDHGVFPVAEPVARHAPAPAKPLGADNSTHRPLS